MHSGNLRHHIANALSPGGDPVFVRSRHTGDGGDAGAGGIHLYIGLRQAHALYLCPKIINISRGHGVAAGIER